MNITVPKDMGSDLRLMPEGAYEATIADVYMGVSQANQPKCTIKYTVTSEAEDLPKGEDTTIGETVLETFSLQPQAMFRLNDLFKDVTGDRLPEGDMTEEEFKNLLIENLKGEDMSIVVETKAGPKGDMTNVTARAHIKKKVRKRKK